MHLKRLNTSSLPTNTVVATCIYSTEISVRQNRKFTHTNTYLIVDKSDSKISAYTQLFSPRCRNSMNPSDPTPVVYPQPRETRVSETCMSI